MYIGRTSADEIVHQVQHNHPISSHAAVEHLFSIWKNTLRAKRATLSDVSHNEWISYAIRIEKKLNQ